MAAIGLLSESEARTLALGRGAVSGEAESTGPAPSAPCTGVQSGGARTRHDGESPQPIFRHEAKDPVGALVETARRASDTRRTYGPFDLAARTVASRPAAGSRGAGSARGRAPG